MSRRFICCAVTIVLAMASVLFQAQAFAKAPTLTPSAETVEAGESYMYEAESPDNTLTGNSAVRDCKPETGCSGGKKIGDFGKNGSSVQFNQVNVPASGIYKMKLSYITQNHDPIRLTVNGGEPEIFTLPTTANWDTLGTYEMEVLLTAGSNTIKFDDNGGWGPDLDKIEFVLSDNQGDIPDNPGESYMYEAESPDNTLTGNSAVRDCKPETGCSGGKKIGDFGKNGSSVQFNQVNVPASGIYKMKLSYITQNNDPIRLTVNGGEPEIFTLPTTANWDTLGTYEMEVSLTAGSNTIKFDDNGGWGPDLDKIELVFSDNQGEIPDNGGEIGDIGAPVSSKKFGPILVTQHKNGVTITNAAYKVIYNTNTGLAAYEWNGKVVATGIYSSAELDQSVSSTDYSEHSFSMSCIEKIKDNHGKGIKVVFDNKQAGLPSMKQIYHIYERQPYFVTSQEIQSETPISTNNMAPIVIHAKGGVDIGSYADNRVLVVPYDNDMWSRYQSRTINTFLNTSSYISSELTAIYDNESRNGLLIGSITHDTWKTGISWSGSDDRLNQLKVFGGFTSTKVTHDTLPHGTITGAKLTSPQIFVGYYDDYRDGLEGFGQANAAVAPPLDFGRNIPKGVPVGWNSWGAYGGTLSYDKVVDVSNFFKANLQNNSFTNKGNIYINLDSYWDWLTPQQLQDVVSIIRKNGQKPGIYDGPFVYWGDNMNQVVPGTDGQYTYGDIVLRDDDGHILPKVDGGYAIDPTHPGTKQYIRQHYKYFLDLGFEYIKIDFLTHASLEGKHYDPNVKTGIQAYNQGLALINEVLDGKMFISESISPLFPSQYAHSRRISCDIDGSLGSTEFQLNNLTYGWWQNGTIYPYTDPDYMTLAKGGSMAAAQTRVNAAAISGTVFLNSDDVNDPTAQQYMKTLLTNPQVNAVALKGKAFRPVEGNTGTAAADLFILQDKHDYYLAVFNYSTNPATKTIDLSRAGITGAAAYTVTDLWTNTSYKNEGLLAVNLDGAQSKLLKITVKPHGGKG
ncbi:CBM35 domain-containing protein [Paenibacillus sp. GCM10023250]|uniref:CBM35 domain-containing protein n=1 Tax=Paenibacillus sp. GCM10023250 TaxID=3252648 RepID=UPI0036205440